MPVFKALAMMLASVLNDPKMLEFRVPVAAADKIAGLVIPALARSTAVTPVQSPLAASTRFCVGWPYVPTTCCAACCS